MTIIGAIPLLVALAAAAIYIAVKHPDVKQLAIYTYAAAILVTLLGLASRVVHLP